MKTQEKQSSERKELSILFSGKWHNQHNSEIDIKVGDDGDVSGTFTTTIRGADERQVFKLTGFASNDVIAFCVAFPRFGSVTSWSGQIANFSDGEPKYTIHTLWHMALDMGKRADTELWRGTLSGSDVFSMGAAELEPGIESMLPPSHPWWIESKHSFSSYY